MVDVIIIGNGPAGISAALYTRRAGLDTLIIGRDSGALAKADKIENYYGFSEPVSGPELLQSGIAAAKRIGVRLVSDEVVGIAWDGVFTVKTKRLEATASSVVIATGSSRNVPRIEGLARLEGKGVSYCAVCDGFFYRGKAVAVIGAGSYAMHEARELLPLAGSVSILTDGREAEAALPEGALLRTEPIREIFGGETVEGVVFRDGSRLALDGIFVAVGVAGSADLAKKIGAETVGTKIAVDQNMATNVPGLYAAGDCTEGMLQIAKAVYDGAKAGTEVIKYVRRAKDKKTMEA